MKLVLSGGAGFTGQRFAAMARGAGHVVLPLDADIRSSKAVAAALADAVPRPEPWVLVHLAALSFVGHGDVLAFYEVNVLGSLNLLDAVAAHHTRPARVLIASSANVYGNCAHSPIAESQAPAPVNHYAASKVAMEHLARTYADRLPIVVARPFNYTGPGQAPQFLIPKLVDHFARREPVVELGNLHVEREYNDVDFVCRSYLHLLTFSESGMDYNICTGVTHTLGEVVSRLTRLTGHHMEIKVNPAFVRSNEIQRLCGDPGRLRAIWEMAGHGWPADDLDSTLSRMLAHARSKP